MLGVNSNSVIFLGFTIADISPTTFLLLEVEASSVGEEEPRKQHTRKAEPWHNVEPGLVVDIVVEDGGEQSTSLAHARGETVSSGSDGSGEDLASNEEGNRVGTKLVEKRGQKVHSLESVDVLRACEVLILERRDDKHQEAHKEADLLHHLAAVQLVVNEERGHIITNQRDGNVGEIPRPGGEERFGIARYDLDKLALEQLVAVEEDIIAEPGTSGREQATSEMSETVTQSRHIVTSNVGAALGFGELL